MFYIFSQDKRIVIPLLEDTLTVEEFKGEFKLYLICSGEDGSEYVTLGKFETREQCTACIRRILEMYVDSDGNGYYEISPAKYYNY